jgi:hypothetical protein
MRKGAFISGIWHCNCTPRLPASRFQVKKEGPNKGRYFYTCQEPEGQRCGFFLWDDEAKTREAGAVLAGRTTEPGAENEMGTGRRSGSPDKNTVEGWNESADRFMVDLARKAEARGSALASVNVTNPATWKYQLEDRKEERRQAIELLRAPNVSPRNDPVVDRVVRKAAELRRMTSRMDDGDEEFGEWPLSVEEEDEAVSTAERASFEPETPRKAIKTSQFATPGSRKTDSVGVWATPQTTSRKRVFDSRDGDFATPTHVKREDDGSLGLRSLPSPTKSPTPVNRRLNFSSIAPPGPSSTAAASVTVNCSTTDYSLTLEVLSLLDSQHVDETVLSDIRTLLNQNELKTAGIVKGRDITRAALKKKDEQIAELQQKIQVMASEREMDKSIIRHFKQDMADSVERRKRGARGRGGVGRGS